MDHIKYVIDRSLKFASFVSGVSIYMGYAIEDHRGLRKVETRSIYGKVLSDLDREFDIYLLAK